MEKTLPRHVPFGAAKQAPRPIFVTGPGRLPRKSKDRRRKRIVRHRLAAHEAERTACLRCRRYRLIGSERRAGARERTPVSEPIGKARATAGRRNLIGHRGRSIRIEAGKILLARHPDQAPNVFPCVGRHRRCRRRDKRSSFVGRPGGCGRAGSELFAGGKRHGSVHAHRGCGRVAGSLIDPAKISLMLVQKSGRSGARIDRTLLVPKGARVDDVTCGILQLVVDAVLTFFGVFLAYTGIAHRPNQLARSYRIASLDMPSIGMNNFVREPIRVPDSDSSVSALSCICHNAGYRRSQRRVCKIDPPLPAGFKQSAIRASIRRSVSALVGWGSRAESRREKSMAPSGRRLRGRGRQFRGPMPENRRRGYRHGRTNDFQRRREMQHRLPSP